MASHAALGASGRVMIERLGRCHLPSLRHVGTHLMTFAASQLLVLCMTKADPKCLHEFRRARVPAQPMASAARRNVTAARFGARTVTAIANDMRVKVARYPLCAPTADERMARRTFNAIHPQVAGVVEF